MAVAYGCGCGCPAFSFLFIPVAVRSVVVTEMVFLPVAQMGVIGGSNDESYTQTDRSGPLKVMGDPHGQPWLKNPKKMAFFTKLASKLGFRRIQRAIISRK